MSVKASSSIFRCVCIKHRLGRPPEAIWDSLRALSTFRIHSNQRRMIWSMKIQSNEFDFWLCYSSYNKGWKLNRSPKMNFKHTKMNVFSCNDRQIRTIVRSSTSVHCLMNASKRTFSCNQAFKSCRFLDQRIQFILIQSKFIELNENDFNFMSWSSSFMMNCIKIHFDRIKA